MMRPCHKYVEFVEANKHLLQPDMLYVHWQHVAVNSLSLDTKNWGWISANPHPDAMRLLRANKDKINWNQLSHNPSPEAIGWLRANPDQISWWNLSQNSSEAAVELLADFPDNIQMQVFFLNTAPSSAALFGNKNDDGFMASVHAPYAKGLERMHALYSWYVASASSAPHAIAAMQANPGRAYWPNLSANRNPDAFALLITQPDWIRWEMLSRNPVIYELDYAAMRRQMAPLREELLRNRMHPRHVHKLRTDWQLMD
jgi:hypothetical protein